MLCNSVIVEDYDINVSTLYRQWPGADILLVVWCYHTWIQHNKTLSRHHVKAISTTTDGTTQQTNLIKQYERKIIS